MGAATTLKMVMATTLGKKFLKKDTEASVVLKEIEQEAGKYWTGLVTCECRTGLV